jgi:uncharacterized damage-inducible protein DinB
MTQTAASTTATPIPSITFTELIEYTDWERRQWHAWLRQHGDDVLKISAGPHGDGRLNTIGEVIRHIFSAEKRYVDRFSDREITDTSAVPSDNAVALFALGDEGRRHLMHFINSFPAAEWDLPREFPLMNKTLRATPRKIMAHVLMHEIRHWAQIATMLRQNGYKFDFHDFLFSPAMGDVFSHREAA